MQPTTLIKIEDCSTATGSGCGSTSTTHHQSTIYEPCKSNSIHTSTITTAVQTSDLSPDITSHHQLYYHSDGNLIQIAPHSHSSGVLEQAIVSSRSPITVSRCLTPPDENENVDNSSVTGPEGNFASGFMYALKIHKHIFNYSTRCNHSNGHTCYE